MGIRESRKERSSARLGDSAGTLSLLEVVLTASEVEAGSAAAEDTTSSLSDSAEEMATGLERMVPLTAGLLELELELVPVPVPVPNCVDVLEGRGGGGSEEMPGTW